MMYGEMQTKIPQIDKILFHVMTAIRAGLDTQPMIDWAEKQIEKLGDEESRAAAMTAVRKLAKIAEEEKK